MPLSSIDFLSPKITLYFNGHNSHISHLGGLLSILFLILLILIIFKFFFDIIDPKMNLSFMSKIQMKINIIKLLIIQE